MTSGSTRQCRPQGLEPVSPPTPMPGPLFPCMTLSTGASCQPGPVCLRLPGLPASVLLHPAPPRADPTSRAFSALHKSQIFSALRLCMSHTIRLCPLLPQHGSSGAGDVGGRAGQSERSESNASALLLSPPSMVQTLLSLPEASIGPASPSVCLPSPSWMGRHQIGTVQRPELFLSPILPTPFLSATSLSLKHR